MLLTSLIFKRFLFSSLYSTKLIKFHDKTGQFHSHECLTSTSFIISLFMLSIQNRRWRLPPLPLFHFSFMHTLHCVQLNQLTVCAHDQTFRVLVERLCANKVAFTAYVINSNFLQSIQFLVANSYRTLRLSHVVFALSKSLIHMRKWAASTSHVLFSLFFPWFFKFSAFSNCMWYYKNPLHVIFRCLLQLFHPQNTHSFNSFSLTVYSYWRLVGFSIITVTSVLVFALISKFSAPS